MKILACFHSIICLLQSKVEVSADTSVVEDSSTYVLYGNVAGRGYIFMLVPVNVNASRNLALFGGGGCYTRQVEVARECGEFSVGS